MMKKLFALLLCICLLLLPACGEDPQEEMVRIFLVTSQKTYVGEELRSSAAFRYDDVGRPLEVDLVIGTGSITHTQLQYDKNGNRTQETVQKTLTGDAATSITTQCDYELTYSNGLLTQALDTQNSQKIALKYDDDARLILVEYGLEDNAYDAIWHSYDYDSDGKLIRETQCRRNIDAQPSGQTSNYYFYARVDYRYDDQGRLAEYGYRNTRSDTALRPDQLDSLDFGTYSFEHYYFYYDKSGKLADVSTSPLENWAGDPAPLYSDEKCTFDEHGNLLKHQIGDGSWTEYTYQAFTVSRKQATMAKRMAHGLCQEVSLYLIDPLFIRLCPLTLYFPYLYDNPFYYLVPYPQFELFL